MSKKLEEKWEKDGNIVLSVSNKNASKLFVFWGPKHGIYHKKRYLSGAKPSFRTEKDEIYTSCNYRKLSLRRGMPLYWCSAACDAMSILTKRLPYPMAANVLRGQWNKTMDRIPPMVRTLLIASNSNDAVFKYLSEHTHLALLPTTRRNVKKVKQEILEFVINEYPLNEHDVSPLNGLTDKNINVIFAICLEKGIPAALISYLAELGYARFRLIKSVRAYIRQERNFISDSWPSLLELETWVDKYHIRTRKDLNLTMSVRMGRLDKVIPSFELDKGEKLHLARYGVDEKIAICNSKWTKRLIEEPDPIGFISYLNQDDHCEECAAAYGTKSKTDDSGHLF